MYDASDVNRHSGFSRNRSEFFSCASFTSKCNIVWGSVFRSHLWIVCAWKENLPGGSHFSFPPLPQFVFAIFHNQTVTVLGWLKSVVKTILATLVCVLSVPQVAVVIGVLTSRMGLRVRWFFGFVWRGLLGRVSSQVLSDVQLDGCLCAENFRFGLGRRAGCCLRCRLMFSWWCVWVSVRRFCGLVLGSLQCSDANVVFRVCCCFAS